MDLLCLMIKLMTRSEIQSTLVLEEAGPAVSGTLEEIMNQHLLSMVWHRCPIFPTTLPSIGLGLLCPLILSGVACSGVLDKENYGRVWKQLLGIGLSMHQVHKDGLPSGNVDEDGEEEGDNRTSDIQPHGCGPAVGGPA